MEDNNMNDFNPIVCRNNAEAFFQTACLIERSRLDFLDDMVVPYAVNLSFACELWMKHILNNYNVSVKKMKYHDLESLFDKIRMHDEGMARRVECTYTEELNNPYLPSLDVFLTVNKDAFEDFRYTHEKDNDLKLYVSCLAALSRSLRKHTS